MEGLFRPLLERIFGALAPAPKADAPAPAATATEG
jgi:hypothetical protein